MVRLRTTERGGPDNAGREREKGVACSGQRRQTVPRADDRAFFLFWSFI
jgi:hypothetical protein